MEWWVLQDVVVAQKGMALIAAAANQVAAFPEVANPIQTLTFHSVAFQWAHSNALLHFRSLTLQGVV